ncbi:MAG: hypothetical protein EOP24_39840 [Hyphomicrobiales bacterium]|nr:MAG: hypothetical protein EOP24_39840 [Hyphomicrobiales bacterium]
MKIPHVDFTKPENIILEMFENDRWVKDEFANSLAQGCQAFAESLAVAFANFPALEKQANMKQGALVVNFIFGVLDDLVVSMKLLVSGKMTASGNLMRQAIEGMCVAILCTAREPIAMGKESVVYWEIVDDLKDERGRSHKAIWQVKANAEMLGIDAGALERIGAARNHYNQFSHPNLLSAAMRMKFGELSTVFVGGTFDEAKLDAYRTEIKDRIGLSNILPGLMRELTKRLANST